MYNDLPWVNSIKKYFSSNGLTDLFDTTNEQKRERGAFPSSSILLQTLANQFHHTALTNLKDTSKLKFYSILKKNICTEKYLTDISNVKHRQALTRLRLSSHTLSIESGRHGKEKIRQEDRICPLCKEGIEDEIHFLFKCPLYKECRDKYIAQKLSPLPNTLGTEQIRHLLLNNDLKPIAKFIYEAFNLRADTIAVQETLYDTISKVEKSENTIHKNILKDTENCLSKLISHIESTEKKPNTFYIKENTFDNMKIMLCRI